MVVCYVKVYCIVSFQLLLYFAICKGELHVFLFIFTATQYDLTKILFELAPSRWNKWQRFNYLKLEHLLEYDNFIM